MERKKIIVVGNGMVGHKLLEQLVAQADAAVEVTVLCEEPRPAYDRVHLSEFFAGKSADELSLVTPGFFEEHGNLVLKLNAKAVQIDRTARTVTTGAGETLAYDKLVLATGSYPFVPPLPGKDRPACLVYRTIEDLEAIAAAGRESKVGVVVGGGLLGLEAAKALKDMNLTTHVVEFAPRLMAVQVDDGGGRILRRKIEELGVTVHTGKNTQEIVDGETCRHRMKFADGSFLETDLILFSAGIRPRDELAKQAGLAMGERGGIVVDEACSTSDPDIYAIGECALYQGRIYGLVAPGYQMAQVVADQLLGKEGAGFTGADMSTKLKLMGVDVASLGDAHGTTKGSLAYSFIDERQQVY
ncbi:MAG: FAD-dependent oxidoreductase, partial [Nevskiales bacterium]